jgi:hypothetical protein
VTQWLGALYPREVVGVHITSAVVSADFADAPPTSEEQAYLDALARYDQDDQGYREIMCTRPDTIAAALVDSPVGLLARIVDKYRDWSDCGGDVGKRWDRDALLTVATLYWATDCIGSSLRQYYDFAHNTPIPRITVPGAITMSNEPALAGFPCSLADRQYADLRHWSLPGRGGHFMAHEEPDQVALRVLPSAATGLSPRRWSARPGRLRTPARCRSGTGRLRRRVRRCPGSPVSDRSE